jgi:Ca2+-binding RTX toxin-like protein
LNYFTSDAFLQDDILTLYGSTGSDLYTIDTSNVRIVEEVDGGRDSVHSTADFNLGGQNVENLKLTGLVADTALGNSLENVVCGNRIDNVIDGRGGDDTVTGWNGDDTVSGGSGDDLFRFMTAPNAEFNVDRITDFVSADDRIGIQNRVFAGMGEEGAMDASQFRLGTKALDGSDRIVYDRASGDMFYDADGSGGAQAILFAQFDAGTAISLGDMFVI